MRISGCTVHWETRRYMLSGGTDHGDTVVLTATIHQLATFRFNIAHWPLQINRGQLVQ